MSLDTTQPTTPETSSATTVRIGTRGSALALAQAALVADALSDRGSASEMVVVETAGDRRAPDTAWGEGAFVSAIEHALLDGRVDVAVHSAKDIPTDEDPRLRIAAYLPREEPRDALVLPPNVRGMLLTLPEGTVVGTDSPRRTGFVRSQRPDIEVRPLHGNVDTRLRRLDEGNVGALVLAAAGLIRLGRSDRISELLPADVVPPAPGQGAIAVQIRADDEETSAAVEAIDDRSTRAEVEAERAFLAATGGGCRAPVGALARTRGGTIELLGGTTTLDGSATMIRTLVGSADEGLGLAVRLARRVVEHRAERLTGPRVLLTRREEDSSRLAARLAQLGVASVVVPAISVELIGVAMEDASGYDVIVVTSTNAVRAITSAGLELSPLRWAAVGRATARELRRFGATDVWMPSEPNGAALARELPIGRGERILRLTSDLVDEGTTQSLRDRGADVDDLVVYRTIIAPPASRPLLNAALSDSMPGAVVFASPSAVRGLLQLSTAAQRAQLLSLPVVAAGATTAAAAREAGFTEVVTSPSPDADAVAELAAEQIRKELRQ